LSPCALTIALRLLLSHSAKVASGAVLLVRGLSYGDTLGRASQGYLRPLSTLTEMHADSDIALGASRDQGGYPPAARYLKESAGRPIRVPSGNTPESAPRRIEKVKRLRQKYSTLPKFGFVVCGWHLTRYEGRIASRHDTWVGCGGRGSVSTRREGQGGQRIEPNPVSSSGRARRTALISSSFQALRARPARALAQAENPAYGKTVWSWLSLLQSSFAEASFEPTGSVSPSIRKATETNRNSSPGRARHKP